MDISLEKISSMQKYLSDKEQFLIRLKHESDNWEKPDDYYVLYLSDRLHEPCTFNHTDQCGYYYDKRSSSYYKRAEKMIKWCKDNEIDIEFMLCEYKSELIKMFK